MIGPKPTPHKGLNDALSLIEFLTNAEEYKKHIERLIEYNQKADNYLRTIGKAEKIDGLHAEAEKDKQTAADLLRDAETKAAQIILEAQEKAENRLEEVKTNISEMIANARLTEKRATEHEKAQDQREKDLTKLEAQLVITNQSQLARETSLKEREKKVTEAETILSQLIGSKA